MKSTAITNGEWTTQLSRALRFLAVCCVAPVVSLFPVFPAQQVRPAGSPHFVLQAGDAAGSIIAIGHDGGVLAVAAQTSVSLFDVIRNLQRRRIDTASAATAMAFAPDDAQLAVGTKAGDVELWSADGARRIRILSGQRTGVVTLAFAPDGRSLAAASSDGTAMRWALPAGTPLQTSRHPRRRNEALQGAAFSSNGEWLVEVAGDLSEWPDGARLQIWSANAASPVRQVKPPPQPPDAVAISSDGRWAAAGTNHSILYIWDTNSAAAAREIETKHWVTSLAFSPDGRTVAVGSMPEDAAGGLELFDTASGRSLWSAGDHLEQVRSEMFSSDGRLLASVSDDGSSRVWDVATGAEKWFAGGYTGATGLAFSPDGEMLATASAGYRIRTWNTRTWTELPPFASPCDLTYTIAFGSSGRVLVAGDRCSTIKVWDVATRRLTRTVAADQVTSLAVSADERFLAWVDNSAGPPRQGWVARVADFRTGAMDRQFAAIPPEGWPFGSVAFTAGGDLLTADVRTVALRDRGTSATRWAAAVANAFGSPVPLPGNRFALRVDNDVQIRSVDSGDIVRVFDLPACGESLAASRDGRWLACGGDRIAAGRRLFNDPVVVVFNAATGEIVRTFSGHTQLVEAMAFSPDGHWLVSGARDRSVRVWDISTLAASR